MSLSGTPAAAVVNAPPDLKLCKPYPSGFTPIRFRASRTSSLALLKGSECLMAVLPFTWAIRPNSLTWPWCPPFSIRRSTSNTGHRSLSHLLMNTQLPCLSELAGRPPYAMTLWLPHPRRCWPNHPTSSYRHNPVLWGLGSAGLAVMSLKVLHGGAPEVVLILAIFYPSVEPESVWLPASHSSPPR